MKSLRKITVRKRGGGGYELRYTKNGQRFSIYGASIAVCRQKYSAVIEQVRPQAKSKGMLFATWYDKYISLYKKHLLKEKTLKELNGLFQLHILPKIGNKPLKRISSHDLQIVINSMANTPRQATIAYMQLKACFEQALKINYITHNPCDAVSIRKNKGNKGKALTIEQEAKLIAYLKEHKPPIKNMIYIYLATGMRRSELLAIHYADLDFEKQEILIRGEKTKNAYRTLQTTTNVLNLFPNKPKPFEEWTASKLTHAFKTITRLLDFKDITIHSLRHTFATRCIEQGVPVVVVQKWLGHASIVMTVDTYTHIGDEIKRDASDMLTFNFL